MQDAGVGQQTHTGCFCSGNDIGMLRGALTDFVRGNKQYFIGTGKGCFQRAWLGIIGLAHRGVVDRNLATKAAIGKRPSWPDAPVITIMVCLLFKVENKI